MSTSSFALTSSYRVQKHLPQENQTDTNTTALPLRCCS